MKIALVSLENSLCAIGFRRMAAVVRAIRPDVEVLHVVPFKATAPLNRLRAKPYQHRETPEIDRIASHLAKSEIIGFSSMSTHARYAADVMQAVRARNPHAFIVWGGIHAIVDPEDAIRYADAVCTGEGEKAFPEFLRLWTEGRDYTRVGNFYFSEGGRVIRNPLLPLHTNEELENLPYPLLGDRECLYEAGRGFVTLEPLHYARLEGLAYNTIWSIGCPNRCVYCGNSKFLKNHDGYGRLRFPSVDHIVGEVVYAHKQYPHLSSVTFHDDMFMALPLAVLAEFTEKWRDEVRLPFAVNGLMSRYVDSRKIRILNAGGMFRVRMGIQSGSSRTLAFFKRPDSLPSIMGAVDAIHRFSGSMMTPSYDLIVDNPTEAREDIVATLRLLYGMPRPFILNVFPLMVIPGTELAEIADRKGLALPFIKQGHPSDSYANALILALCLWRPPRRLFEFLLKRLDKPGVAARRRPATMRLLLSCLAAKRALAHLCFGNFSVLPSRMTWILWKTGIVKLANRRILRRCLSASTGSSPDGSVS